MEATTSRSFEKKEERGNLMGISDFLVSPSAVEHKGAQRRTTLEARSSATGRHEPKATDASKKRASLGRHEGEVRLTPVIDPCVARNDLPKSLYWFQYLFFFVRCPSLKRPSVSSFVVAVVKKNGN